MSDDIRVVIEGEERGDPVAALKGQLNSLKSTAASAVQRASVAEAEAGRARVRVADLEKKVVERDEQTIGHGIGAAKAEADAAQAALEAALTEGDAKAAAAAQRKLSTATAQIVQMESEQAAMKSAPKPVAQAEDVTDPVERVARTVSPKSAAWIRSNPDAITDPRKNALMMAGHHEALANGITVDSDQYFETINNKIGGGERKAAKVDLGDDVEVEQDFTTQRRPVAPVAPGATAGGSGGGSRTTVKLTATEAASATDGTIPWNYDDPNGKFKKGDPIGVKEFARRKQEMTKQGVYDRTYVDQQ